MITEEKKKALEELNRMIEQFADEHDIEVFMIASVTEKRGESTDQVLSEAVIGRTGSLTSAIIGCMRADVKTAAILFMAVDYVNDVQYSKFNATKG